MLAESLRPGETCCIPAFSNPEMSLKVKFISKAR
jgi:hypothetical protein